MNDRPPVAAALLAVALAIECVAVAWLGIDGLGALLDGASGWLDTAAVFALAWLVVVLALLLRTLHDIGGLHAVATDRGARFRAVASTSHEWIWQSTTDLLFSYASPGVCDVLGYLPHEVVGRSGFDLIHPDDVPVVRETVAAALRHGTGWRKLTVRWRHADGRMVTLEGDALPMVSADGRIVGFHGTRRPVDVGVEAAQRLAGIHRRTTALLDSGDLRIALQPIVDIGTGRWVGVEALSRFPDNRPPDVVFAEAHEAGLGAELELLALRTALEVLPDLPPEVYFSVNASPTLLLDPRFADELLHHDVERVMLEITEHAVVERYDEVQAVLLPLRERGLRLAVDDTGAGYASFSHVLRLRPDVIKLDRSLLSHVVSDAAARALVTAVVLLGLEMRATVTAEGVETAPALQTVGALGVDTAQGYLLARPTDDRSVWATWQGRRWDVALSHADGPVVVGEAR